jgi:hypothetical protein
VRSHVRRGFNARGEAGGAAFNDQALEHGFVVGRPAHAELEQLLAVAGFCRDVLAGAACQQQAGVGIGAQKGRCRAVVDVQAFEQAVGGVAAAGAFGAEQLEAEIAEQVGLGLRGQGLNGFQNLAHRQVGGIGRQGRYAEGGDTRAQQQDCKGGGDPFGVAAKGVGEGIQKLGGVWQAQSKIPN